MTVKALSLGERRLRRKSDGVLVTAFDELFVRVQREDGTVAGGFEPVRSLSERYENVADQSVKESADAA